MSEKSRIVHHCSHWGAYDLCVAGGTIVDVLPAAGDPNPSDIRKSVTGWLDPTYRIAQPMVRAGWLNARHKSDGSARGSEEFVPVSWDTALDLVAGEIGRVQSDHGPASIFAGSYGWASSGRLHHPATLLKRLLGLTGGFTGHIDTYSIAAGPAILRHVLGNDGSCKGAVNSLEDISLHCETLLVFGAMTPRTAQIEAGGLTEHRLEVQLRALKERGVKIIHISPFKDDLPAWLEAEWWPIQPGTDTALMLALGQELIAKNTHDAQFLEQYCSGSDLLLEYLSGKTDGVAKTADWAARITGLNAENIRQLAARIANTRTQISVSWSLQRAEHGEQPFWAAIALAALLGQIGLPGRGFGFGYGSLGGVGIYNGVGAIGSMPLVPNPANSAIPVARIADMLLHPGMPYSHEGKDCAYPDARMVYWAGGNPFHHHQDLHRLERAWAKPETIVVQEVMWTATALRADIVLPAVSSIERNDFAGGRRSGGIIAMQQAVEPLGNARSDFAIFSDLARRLGLEDAFTEGRDEMQWLRHLYNKCRADVKDQSGVSLPDFDAFWSKGVVHIPSVSNAVHLSQFRENPKANPLKTQSGKIVLGSDTLARLKYDDCRAHPAWIAPKERRDIHRDKDKPALHHLLSIQPQHKLHSQLDAAGGSLAAKKNGHQHVLLNTQSAAAIGVEAGQLVRLFNARGACVAYAKLTDDLAENVAILPTGSWLLYAKDAQQTELSGNPNVLTNDVASSQFGQGCAAHSCLVEIAPEHCNFPNPLHQYQSLIQERTRGNPPSRSLETKDVK